MRYLAAQPAAWDGRVKCPDGMLGVIVIFHNPQCSTSRKVLDLIRDRGLTPEIVDYRKAGWTRGLLLTLFAAAGVTPAQALRVKGDDPKLRDLQAADDEAILAAMVADPLLVQRPFVAGPGGVRLCRPVESVLNVLETRG